MQQFHSIKNIGIVINLIDLVTVVIWNCQLMKINTAQKLSSRIGDEKSIILSFRVTILIIGLALICSFLSGRYFYRQGYHFQIKYILQGRFNELQDGPIKDAFIELADSIKVETSAYFSNNLSTLYLDIPFESVQTLKEKRDQAVEDGILLSSDADFVQAEVRYNDSSTIGVKIRLKGDWTDHLTGDKWSYRINILDDAAIEGMRRFSIQAPETRSFLNEWAYHEHLIKKGILAPRYFFVNVIINGEYKGVYAMEESFNTELIESQQRRAGVLLRYDESDMWQNWAPFFAKGEEELRTGASTSGYFMNASFESANVSPFAGGPLAKDPVLFEEYQSAQSLLRSYQMGQMSASEVFDLDVMGDYLAITELWGAGHAMAWHNIRFYYNPVTNLLEPIGYDGIPMEEPYVSMDLYDSYDPNGTYGISFLFRDEEIRQAFYKSAKKIFADNEIESIRNGIGQELDHYRFALENEYDVDLSINWDMLYTRRDSLQAQLILENPIRGYAQLNNIPENEMVLSLENNFIMPIVIKNVSYRKNGQTYELSLTDQNETALEYNNGFIPISISLTDQEINDIALLNIVTVDLIVDGDPANKTSVDIPIMQQDERLSMPVEQEVPAVEAMPTQLVYPAGKWRINQTIYVNTDQRLVVYPGAKLSFAPQAGILCEGELQFLGSAEQPITLQGIQDGDSWGGINLLGTNGQSRMENVLISGSNSNAPMNYGLINMRDAALLMQNVKIKSIGGIGILAQQSDINAKNLDITQLIGTAILTESSAISLENSDISGGEYGFNLAASTASLSNVKVYDVDTAALYAAYASTAEIEDGDMKASGTIMIATDYSRLNILGGRFSTSGKSCMIAYSSTDQQFNEIQMNDADFSGCDEKIFRTTTDIIRNENGEDIAIEVQAAELISQINK
jgi:hypothetical protein